MSTRGLLLFIVILSLTLRTAALVQLEAHDYFAMPQMMPDSSYNHWMAERIAGGDLLAGNAPFYNAPLYSYLLGMLYRLLGPNPLALKVVQVLLGGVLPLLVFALGNALFSRRAGLLAAAVSALYLPFVFYDALLMKTSVAVFVLVLAMLVLVKAAEKRRAVWWLAGGGLLGLSALLRPNVLLFLPLAAGGILWIERREGVWKAIAHALVLAAGFFILVAPATLRNLYLGDTVLIGSNGGFSFYIGNNPRARPVYRRVPGISGTVFGEQADTRRVAEAAAGRPLRPSEVSSFWLNRGLTFVKEHPIHALRLCVGKFLLALNHMEVPNTENFYFARQHASVLRLPLFTFLWVLPLGILGIWFGRSGRPGKIFVDLFLLSTLLTLTLFYVTARYRVPAAPFLIVYASHAALRLWDRFRAAQYLKMAGPLLAVGLIGGISSLNLYPQLMHDVTSVHINAANCYQHMGLFDKALGALEKARSQRPKDSRIPELMGVCVAEKGDRSRALSLFREALSLEPANPATIHHRMGALFLKYRELERAEEAFQKAIAYDPYLARAHAYLGVVRRLRGDGESAVRFLTRARELQPGWPVIYLELARSYEQCGEREEARNVLKEGLRLDPGNRAMSALMKKIE